MSKKRDKHDLTIKSMVADEEMTLENLLLAESLFARIVVRSLTGSKGYSRGWIDRQQDA